MSAYITKAKVIAIAIPLLLGQIVGAIQGEDSLTWFKVLKKPSWCPPVPAFPIVWTTLYALMGYASYIVWTYGGWEAQKGPLLVYGLQLGLNLLWPVLFFKAKKLRLSAVGNILLLASAALTANSFWRVDKLAGKLMFPYLAWLVLANALNFNITAKNDSADQNTKLADNYHSDDKRNPGEQGFFAANPTSASLQLPKGGRNRTRLTVFGQAAAARPQARVFRTAAKAQMRRPQHAAALNIHTTRTVFA